MTKNKLNLNSLKEQANQLATNEDAKKFVQGAKSKPISPEPKSAKTNKERKLIVEGQLKNRDQTCQKPIQLYLRNEHAEWIQKHAIAGRGGLQILINHLVKRGIDSVEQEYESKGIVFAEDNPNTGS